MSFRSFIGASISVMLLAGCRGADVETVQPAPQGSVQPAPVDASMLPANSLLTVELNHTLSTETSRVGDRFTARVINSIRAQNGALVIPSGAVVSGRITALDDSDHIGDQALIRVDFQSLQFNGRTYPLNADVVDTEMRLEGERRRAERGALAGAAAGAVVGAVISGFELDNILRAAAIGAGAGTVISLGVGDVEAALPAGTDMTLRTTSAIQLY